MSKKFAKEVYRQKILSKNSCWCEEVLFAVNVQFYKNTAVI